MDQGYVLRGLARIGTGVVLPFQRFRMRLVDRSTTRRSSTATRVRFFNLDGQTIVLEDYLQIRPE